MLTVNANVRRIEHFGVLGTVIMKALRDNELDSTIPSAVGVER